MKKFLLWLLTLIITLPAMARDFSYSYSGKTLTYEVLDEDAKTCAVKTRNQVSGALEIPASASDGSNDFSVTTIGESAFDDCRGLVSVTIPNSVTTIGNKAFSYCIALVSTNVGDSVTSIGNYSFYGCKSLLTISIPNSVKTIGNYAFSDCKSLSSVIIGDSVTAIGLASFSDCKSLLSLKIGPSVKSIDADAFLRCSSLIVVDIPNSVTSIGNYAFCNCSYLSSVTIGKHVTSVANNTFYGCTQLIKSAYPNHLINPFQSGYTIAYDSADAIIEDGFIFGSNKSSIIFAPLNLTGDYIVPNSVTSIGEGALSYCSKLTSISIPNSLTDIGKSAFRECIGLTSITIPNSVDTINDYTFFGCQNLKTATLGDSTTSIRERAFSHCFHLGNVDIPHTVKSIGEYAFYFCGLTSVVIPKSVTFIGQGAFDQCSGLIKAAYPNTLDYLFTYGKLIPYDPQKVIFEDGFIYGLNKSSILYAPMNLSREYIVPNSVTYIGISAFRGCSELKSVIIPRSVNKIGGNAFSRCFGLKEVHCLATDPPKCDGNTYNLHIFDNIPASCELFVPKNSVNTYQANAEWKNFTNIIGYYVSGGENESLYIQDFFIEPGEVTYMPVRLRADRDYSDFTTDVCLPEGIEPVIAENGKVDVLFARDDGRHITFANVVGDSAIRVSVKTVDYTMMAENGNDVLFYIRVKANDNLSLSSMPIWFRNTTFKDANFSYLFKDTHSNINIEMGIVDVDVSKHVLYYNLQGVRVAQPERGQVYICVQGGKASKLVF